MYKKVYLKKLNILKATREHNPLQEMLIRLMPDFLTTMDPEDS